MQRIQGTLSGVTGAYGSAYNWGFRPGKNGGAFNVPNDNQPYNRYNGDYNPEGGSGATASFDSARVTRVSPETRPKNVALLYCVKN